MGKLQGADHKTYTELSGDKSKLMDDDKVYISANSIDKTLKEAIEAGDLEGPDTDALVDLTDVVIATPLDGQVLTYDSVTSKWKNEVGGTTLAGLTDVDFTSLTNNQIIKYNTTTTKWENDDYPVIPAVLNDLGDVVLTLPVNTDVLTYNGTNWVNTAPSGGSVAFNDLTDVTTSGASTINTMIRYNSNDGLWKGSQAIEARIPNYIYAHQGIDDYWYNYWTLTGGGGFLSAGASSGQARVTGNQATRLTKATGNAQDGYMKFQTFGAFESDRGGYFQVVFDYKTSAGFVTNDVQVVLYDVTNSANFTAYSGTGLLSNTSTWLKSQTVFTCPSNCVLFEIRFIIATTTNPSWELDLDMIEVKPIEQPYSASSAPSFTTVTKTASATLLTTGENIIECVPASNMTLTLPTAVGNNGLKYEVKSLNTLEYTITIDPNGSETIDDKTTLLLSNYGDFIHLVSDGTNWIITSSNLYSSPNHSYVQNGDFNFQQYTSITSATAMVSGTYPIDRWKSQVITATGTVQHIFGGPNSLRWTIKVVATSTGTGYLNLIHQADATKDLRGKKATLSFWYKSDMTNFKVRWDFGVSAPSMPAIATSSVWKFYTLSHEVPTNATYIDVQLGPQNNSITSGQFYQICAVKLEMGEIPTEFESKDTWNVCAQAYSITTQAFATGVYTTIIHDAEAEDAHGAYNNSTGIFTCPVAGRYLVTCHLILDSNGLQADPPEAMYLRAHKSGSRSEIKFVGDFTVGHNVAGYRLGINGSTVFNCEKGDTLFFQAQQNTGASYVTLVTGSSITSQINNSTFTLIGAPV